MTIKTQPFDAADYLDSDEAVVGYLAAAFEDGDEDVIAAAIGDVARARGMTEVAKRSGLSRESLYRSLSEEGHPEFATILKVLRSLGVRLTAQAPSDVSSSEEDEVELSKTSDRISISLSRDVIEQFKSQGPGWQGRIDDALKKAVGG